MLNKGRPFWKVPGLLNNWCGVFNVQDIVPVGDSNWALAFYGTRAIETTANLALTGPNTHNDFAQLVHEQSGTTCVRNPSELLHRGCLGLLPYVPVSDTIHGIQTWCSLQTTAQMENFRAKDVLHEGIIKGKLPVTLALPPGTVVVPTNYAIHYVGNLLRAYEKIFARYGSNADGNYGNKAIDHKTPVGEILRYVNGHNGAHIVFAKFLEDLLETIGLGFDSDGIIGINTNLVRPDHGEGSVGTGGPHPLVFQDPQLVNELYRKVGELVSFFISKFGLFPYASLDIARTPQEMYLLEGNMRSTNFRWLVESVYKVLFYHGLLDISVAEFNRQVVRGESPYAMVKSDKIRCNGYVTSTQVVQKLEESGLHLFDPSKRSGIILAHQPNLDGHDHMVGLSFVSYNPDPKVACVQVAEMYIAALRALGDTYEGEVNHLLELRKL